MSVDVSGQLELVLVKEETEDQEYDDVAFKAEPQVLDIPKIEREKRVHKIASHPSWDCPDLAKEQLVGDSSWNCPGSNKEELICTPSLLVEGYSLPTYSEDGKVADNWFCLPNVENRITDGAKYNVVVDCVAGPSWNYSASAGVLLPPAPVHKKGGRSLLNDPDEEDRRNCNYPSGTKQEPVNVDYIDLDTFKMGNVKCVKDEPIANDQCMLKSEEKLGIEKHLMMHESKADKSLVSDQHEFLSPSNLLKHVENTDKQHACGFCSYQTNSRFNLKKHLHVHLNIEEKLFACDQCEYKSNNKSNLTAHSRTHDRKRDKPFACDQCEYRSDFESHIKRHSIIHDIDRDKPFACNQCKFCTHRKDILKMHMLKHETNRPKLFSCLHCEYTTDHKKHLKVHMITHDLNGIQKNREKLFACNQCDHRTDRKSLLNNHLLLHKSDRDRRFVCDHCEYRTDKKKSLKVHLLTHESKRNKPFLCNHCKYRTDRSSSLKRHLVKHDAMGVTLTQDNLLR